MRTLKRATLMIVFLSLSVPEIASAGSPRPQAKTPSNTWQMRCIVKTTADAEVLPLSFELLELLVKSDAVAGEAARTTWPAGHGVPDAYLDIRPLEDGDVVDDAASSEIGGSFPARTRTVLLGLRVHLDSEVGPVAREFGNAVIENLRTELREAFAAHAEDLRRQLAEAENRRETLREEFKRMLRDDASTAPEPIQLNSEDEAVYEQLDKIVDLSSLTQQTPANEAFVILRNSVQPPLNLIVFWRDLLDNANIEPTSPIEMNGPANIRLGTALKSLLDAISDPLATGKEYRVDYVVTGGTITVATRLGLPQRRLETHVYDVPRLLRMDGQAPELAALIRETIEPDSWRDLYVGLGNGTVAASADGKLIVSQSRDVHIKIAELLSKIAVDSSVALTGEASQETLAGRLESLLSYREQLEGELNRLQDRQGQIARERNQKERQTVKETIQSIANDLSAAAIDLKNVGAVAAKTSPDSLQSEKLQQTTRKIDDCLTRCNQTLLIMRSGFDLDAQLPWPDLGEERTITDRIAAKQHDLREVSRRIGETQRMMAGSKTFDAELSRIQWAARRCEQAEARVHNIKTRIENLQPCTITLIGGTE
ncbi:MAG: hypothetical protein ACM3VT_20130 [Solirubrobacterales bacterium]